jgi:hypothetical protein
MEARIRHLRSALIIDRWANPGKAWVSPCGEYTLPYNGRGSDEQQAIDREFHLIVCEGCPS